MSLSDQLTELATRAKTAEQHAAAAQGKAVADVQADVESARASAQLRAKNLHQSAEANKTKLSAWWYDLQRTWNEHITKIRDDVDAKRAGHDAERAERRAERRTDDAVFAIEFAFAAIEEAEYAVLAAELAKMEAEELSVASSR